MEKSLYSARLIGPFLVAVALGILVNPSGYRALADEFLRNAALIYLSGLLALIGGLVLVLAHNVWRLDWRLIVTLLGWLAIIGGITRIVLPQEVQIVGTSIMSHPATPIVSGIAILILGAVLSFYGYVAPQGVSAKRRKRS